MTSRLKIIILVSIVFVVVALVYALHSKDKNTENQNLNSDITTLDSGKIYALHNIEDKDSHTVVGNVVLPNPCSEITVEAVVAESMPEQVTILFSMSEGSGFCAQVVIQKYFEVKFHASKGAKIRAMFNSAPVDLILQNVKSEEIINFIITNKWKTKI